jgi:hypothetical protein
MLWFKRFSVFAGVCALAAGVVHAQSVAITGADFESGAADAKLAEIARQAAASGKTVVVTTPPYWQAKVAGKIRAAAPSVQVKTSDAFFENVLVRIVDVEKPKAEAAVAAKPAVPAVEPAAAAPAAPAKTAARIDTRAAAVAATPAAEPQPRESTTVKSAEPPQVALAKPAPAPVAATPPPSPAVAETLAAPVHAAPLPAPAATVATISPPPSARASQAGHVTPAADTAAIKHAFENQFNLGRPAIGAIGPVQLRKGDEIFVRGPVRAVVRRDRNHVDLFWVEGDLNLDRAELVKTSTDRYRVDEAIRDVANPSLRAMHSEPKMFTAHRPAAKVRTDMERHFNDAKVIAVSMAPGDLRYGDLFYIYRSHAVVFRRTDLGFDRYWLEGEIDLNQSGVIKSGDAYRIVSEKL